MRKWPASGGPFSFPSPATNPRPFFVDRTRRDEWDNFVLPVQRALPRLKTAAAAGRHRDTLADLLAGRSRPHSRTRERLTAVSPARATSAARLGARVWGRFVHMRWQGPVLRPRGRYGTGGDTR